jgi:hypothetical protein
MIASILIILCIVAAVLEFACLRDPSIPDNALSLVGRRLLIAGWLLLCVRFSWVLMEGQFERINTVAVLGIAFIALANIIRCSNRLVLTDFYNPQRLYKWEK